MHDGTTWVVFANFGWKTCEGPSNQGSRRMVKEPGKLAEESVAGAQ